jgi:hypothetical protein
LCLAAERHIAAYASGVAQESAPEVPLSSRRLQHCINLGGG